MISLIDEMNALPYERVNIASYDGLKLSARYYHIKDGAPLQIQFHGYRGTAIRDFCGGNKLARENGFNTLVIDQRAHGLSEGHTISFGIKERFDCLSWVEYANKRFGENTPIYLAGVSMGAATVLMASELNLPSNVKALIADCPYSSPAAIIKKVCRDKKFPVFIMYPLIALGARLYGRFGLNASSAVSAVKNTKLPILVIHGKADRFVPYKMSEQIKEANPAITLESFEGAGHGISYIVDPYRYGVVALDFINRN